MESKMNLKICSHAGTPNYPRTKASKEQKQRKDVVTTCAAEDLIKESERRLNNTDHCRHLEHDPTKQNNATVSKVMTGCKNYKFIGSN